MGVVTSFTQNEAETLGQSGDFKNVSIWLKFCTLGPWVNTWGYFFHFFKILIFMGVVTSFTQNKAENFGVAWRLQKLSDLAEILYTWTLGESLGVFFSFFSKFSFLGAWSTGFVPLSDSLGEAFFIF